MSSNIEPSDPKRMEKAKLVLSLSELKQTISDALKKQEANGVLTPQELKDYYDDYQKAIDIISRLPEYML
jgi:ribosome recycling factor